MQFLYSREHGQALPDLLLRQIRQEVPQRRSSHRPSPSPCRWRPAGPPLGTCLPGDVNCKIHRLSKSGEAVDLGVLLVAWCWSQTNTALRPHLSTWPSRASQAVCMVQRVSLRSQDFILVHADKLCVCRGHYTVVICNLAAGCLGLPQCTADHRMDLA